MKTDDLYLCLISTAKHVWATLCNCTESNIAPKFFPMLNRFPSPVSKQCRKTEWTVRITYTVYAVYFMFQCTFVLGQFFSFHAAAVNIFSILKFVFIFNIYYSVLYDLIADRLSSLESHDRVLLLICAVKIFKFTCISSHAGACKL